MQEQQNATQSLDITPDGKQIIFDRIRENSGLVPDRPETVKGWRVGSGPLNPLNQRSLDMGSTREYTEGGLVQHGSTKNDTNSTGT